MFSNNFINKFAKSNKALVKCFSAMCLVASVSSVGVNAQEAAYNDGMMQQYYAAAKGKTVGFVPIALGFDITTEYLAKLQEQSKELGYKVVVKDPNWSIDKAVQAVEQLIADKPDIIVAHPLDGAAMNRLVKKANDAGIYWVWVMLKGQANGDAFVGANAYGLSQTQVRLATEYCKTAKSNKIAFMQSPPSSYSAIAGTAGLQYALKNNSNLQLVSLQSADADANKAKAIAATVLKQNPDLCAFIGQWDGQDIGISAAVSEAGLKGKVGIFTTGGGSKKTACDKVEDGSFTADISYDIEGQGRDLNNVIMQLLQSKAKPGSQPYATYAVEKIITAKNVKQANCWTQ